MKVWTKKGMKCCHDCKCVKKLEKFPKHKETRDGRRSCCRKCMNIRKKEWRYENPDKEKASKERFRLKNPNKNKEYSKRYCDGKGRWKRSLSRAAKFAIEQGHLPCNATSGEIEIAFIGKCHVCGVSEKKCNSKLAMDHCHLTGNFRGWLCRNCNAALGFMKDSPKTIIALAGYVEYAGVKKSA